MSRLALIAGGGRSGKSAFSVALARRLDAPTLVLATCLPGDDAEMRARVAAHQRQRPPGWRLCEEGYALETVLETAAEALVILDCVPTWLGNLLIRGDTDAQLEAAGRVLAAAVGRCRARWVLAVSAEVGAGLVPETSLGRRFRDAVGAVNQLLSAQAARVYLMVAGLPVEVKRRAASVDVVAGDLREEWI